MRIIDKKDELTEYHYGDVIKDGDSVYLVCENAEREQYALVDLSSGRLTDAYDSLSLLFDEVHSNTDELVNAEVVIRGDVQ